MDKLPKGLSPQDLAAWINEHYHEDGTLMNNLKMKVKEAGPERVIVEAPVDDGVYAALPFVHAGGMISLTDSAATWATLAAYRGELDENEIPVAVTVSSQIVGNTQEGTLVAEATVTHPGRTLMVAATRVTDDNGRLLALVNSTHFVRPR